MNIKAIENVENSFGATKDPVNGILRGKPPLGAPEGPAQAATLQRSMTLVIEAGDSGREEEERAGIGERGEGYFLKA